MTQKTEKTWKLIALAILLLLCLLFLIGCASNKSPILENASNQNFTGEELPIIEQQETPPETVEDSPKPILYGVIGITDGDTFILNNGDKVRLICIDTPEKGDYYYEEASNYLEDLILNKEVTLLKDVSETDRYGRLLRYVYIGETFVNYALVEEGYAKVYRYPPDTSKCGELELAEAEAKRKHLGIWEETRVAIAPANNNQPSSNYVCSSNSYNCGDFSSHAEAQRVYDACGGVSNDVHQLDRDKDGVACDSLS